MTRVVAALDHGPSLEPVARAARALAALMDAEAVGVHVAEPGSPSRATLERRARFPVARVEGDTVEALVDAIENSDVAIAVVGARSHAEAPRPTGHVPLELAERLTRPLLVVPPHSTLGTRGRVRRVLVPLDGSRQTSAAARRLVRQVRPAGIEVIVTHVLDDTHPLHFADAPQHDYDAWRREFLARHAVPGTDLDVRQGNTWEAIEACAHEVTADLIVVVWSQRLASGRAEVVRAALANPDLPVLLLPTNAQHRVGHGP
jgi:nucleotide-binding universal stress UspA family protein